jgi:Flp pilus assembly protein TadG
VETAVSLPILATLILGIFQCGILFNNYIQLTNATGEGADYLQTIRQSSTDPCTDTFTAIANAAPSLNKNSITLKVILNNTSTTTATASTYTGTGATAAACSGHQTQLVSQAPATVTASYPASLLIYGRNFFATGANISQTVTIYEY